MYVDPPYTENGCNYKHNMRSWDAHKELADKLRAATCKWIYSSYDTPEIRALFLNCHIVSVQSASGMANKKHGTTRVTNQEVLITNIPTENDNVIVPAMLSQTSLVLEALPAADGYHTVANGTE